MDRTGLSIAESAKHGEEKSGAVIHAISGTARLPIRERQPGKNWDLKSIDGGGRAGKREKGEGSIGIYLLRKSRWKAGEKKKTLKGKG